MNIMVIILTVVAFGAGILGYFWDKSGVEEDGDKADESDAEGKTSKDRKHDGN